MRVLVTGGAGYIGSVVTESLVNRGHSVIVYDNLSTGHRQAVDERAALVEGDILDTRRLAGTLATWNIEAVVHMAALALVGVSVTDPSTYYRVNLQGGLSLLDAMRDTSVTRLVFSSTCAIFGEPARVPMEEDDPKRPANPYGQTKLALEDAIGWYERAYGLRAVCLRYFNASGASERFGEDHEPETHLIPKLLRVAAGREPEATLFGDDYPTRDGTCVRDYIHILDLAHAHLLAIESTEAGSARYNLGCGGDGYSNREVLDSVRRVTGREVPARIGPRRPGDPAALVASSARIHGALGWAPKHQDLDAIVSSAWSWHQRFPEGYPR